MGINQVQLGKSISLFFEVIKDALRIAYSVPWIWLFALFLTSSQLADLLVLEFSTSIPPSALRWIVFLSSFPVVFLMMIGMIGITQLVWRRLNKQQVEFKQVVSFIRKSFWPLAFFYLFLFLFVIIPGLLIHLIFQVFISTNASLFPLVVPVFNKLVTFVVVIGSATVGVSMVPLLIMEMKAKHALKIGWSLIVKHFLTVVLLASLTWVVSQAHFYIHTYLNSSPALARIIQFTLATFSYGLSTLIWTVFFYRVSPLDYEPDMLH